MVIEKITAHGHPLVAGTHRTTIEITKENFLTKKGDCIIGIKASKACADLSSELKRALKSDAKFNITFRIGYLEEKISGFGSPDLILSNEKDIVLRKSLHIDDRTLLIKCDKACSDFSRRFINKLKTPGAKLEMIIFY